MDIQPKGFFKVFLVRKLSIVLIFCFGLRFLPASADSRSDFLFLKLQNEGLLFESDFIEVKKCHKAVYQTYLRNFHQWHLNNRDDLRCDYHSQSGAVGKQNDAIKQDDAHGDSFTLLCVCLEWTTQRALSEEASVRILSKLSDSLGSLYKTMGSIPDTLKADPDFIRALADELKKVSKH